MKIISTYKDYYDYLTGVYGIDDKIILDRRTFDSFYHTGTEKTKIRLFICDMVFEGVCFEGKYYWGENVFKLVTQEELEVFHNSKNRDKIFIQTGIPQHKFANWSSEYSTGRYNFTISLQPYSDKYKRNTKHQCAIEITSNVHEDTDLVCRYPILKDLGIASILPAHDIYLMLTAWLAPKENHQDTRNDAEKITGAGFDLKTSFRNIK